MFPLKRNETNTSPFLQFQFDLQQVRFANLPAKHRLQWFCCTEILIRASQIECCLVMSCSESTTAEAHRQRNPKNNPVSNKLCNNHQSNIKCQ